jgi:hypothetical protein
MPWLAGLIDRQKIFSELKTLNEKNIVRSPTVYQRMREPALLRFYFYAKNKELLDKTKIEGSSPPDLFVGRFGYPFVFIGPLVPPEEGDTSLLSTPEFWVGKNIAEIVDFRMRLVRTKFKTRVNLVEEGKLAQKITDTALAKRAAHIDAELLKKPSARILLDDHVQPFGPSAPLKNFEVENVPAEQKIEKVYYDTDLKAADAVMHLFENGVLISKIQRALSAGLLGLKKNRRFVPTRWSITAVDSIVSADLIEQVKTFPLINEYEVYEITALDNRWFILLIPNEWSYELIEAWYPGTLWNPTRQTAIFSSHENFFGRKTSAEIGGCYYAARLAVTEYLQQSKRQATVVIFREAHPGYLMPVGVWNVREHVRAALKNSPTKFASLSEALNYIFSKLEIPAKVWLDNSSILKQIFFQKKIADFLNFKNF